MISINLGYEFAPEFWGCGYATEANRAVLQYAFETIERDRVVAYAQPANLRSVRVLDKLGFLQDGYCQDGAGNECAFYVLAAQSWRLLKKS